MMKNKMLIMNWRWALLICGLVSILFGVVAYKSLPAEEHSLIMLTGMFSGVGTAFFAVGVRGFVLNKKLTPEQKRQAEIDSKDERNVMITGKAYIISSVVTSAFFVISSFVLVGLGNRVAAYFCIAGMYFQVISRALAQIYYRKKL